LAHVPSFSDLLVATVARCNPSPLFPCVFIHIPCVPTFIKSDRHRRCFFDCTRLVYKCVCVCVCVYTFWRIYRLYRRNATSPSLHRLRVFIIRAARTYTWRTYGGVRSPRRPCGRIAPIASYRSRSIIKIPCRLLPLLSPRRYTSRPKRIHWLLRIGLSRVYMMCAISTPRISAAACLSYHSACHLRSSLRSLGKSDVNESRRVIALRRRV